MFMYISVKHRKIYTIKIQTIQRLNGTKLKTSKSVSIKYVQSRNVLELRRSSW